MDRRNREVRLKMAIIPETEFPGKIIPGNASYPYGQARDITTPSDGTGTPLRASLVNDIFGFQQALLAAAGVTPSGAPDTAVASQYLQAIQALIADGPKVKAWARFGYISGSIVIAASYGIDSIARSAMGKYVVTLSDEIAGAAYCVTANSQQIPYYADVRFGNIVSPINISATGFELWCGDNNTDAFFDSNNVNFQVVG